MYVYIVYTHIYIYVYIYIYTYIYIYIDLDKQQASNMGDISIMWVIRRSNVNHFLHIS